MGHTESASTKVRAPVAWAPRQASRAPKRVSVRRLKRFLGASGGSGSTPAVSASGVSGAESGGATGRGARSGTERLPSPCSTKTWAKETGDAHARTS